MPAPSAPQKVDCRQRLADLTARRAELKRRVENLATAKQSFDEAPPGARNAALEAELRKRLRLEGRNDWLPPDVECRALVCRVQNAVATRSGTYFRIRDESVPAGVDVVERFVDDFRRSRAIDGCTARFHDEGKLFVQLNLGAEDDPLNELPPGLSLRMPNGALADTPLAMCIIHALRDVFGRASLPPVYTSVVGYPVVFPP